MANEEYQIYFIDLYFAGFHHVSKDQA